MKKTLRAILRLVPYGVLCRLLYETDLRIKQSDLYKNLNPILPKSKRKTFVISSLYRRIIFGLDSLFRSVLFTEHIKRPLSDACSYFNQSFNDKVFKEMSARVMSHTFDHFSASPYDKLENVSFPFHPFEFRLTK